MIKFGWGHKYYRQELESWHVKPENKRLDA